jgi:hypothetical protein
MNREEIERNANLIAEAYALAFETWQQNISYKEISQAEKLAKVFCLKDEIKKIKAIDAIQEKLMEDEIEDVLDHFLHAESIKEIHEYIENTKKRKNKAEENKKEFEKILEKIKAEI